MFRLVWVDFGDLGWIRTIRLICNGSAGFRFLLIDAGRFYAISTIWQVGLRICFVIAILLNLPMILHVIIMREENMVVEIFMLLNYLSLC